MRSCWVSLSPHRVSLVKEKRHTDTQGRKPCEARGRDWSDAFTGQGKPRIASRPREPEEARKDSSCHLWVGALYGPASTLISDSWTPELWRNKFLLSEASWCVVICYGSSEKLLLGRLHICTLTPSPFLVRIHTRVLGLLLSFKGTGIDCVITLNMNWVRHGPVHFI